MCGVYVVAKVRHSNEPHGLLASVLCLSENLIPLMLLSIVSCLYPLFFIFSICLTLYIWNVG